MEIKFLQKSISKKEVLAVNQVVDTVHMKKENELIIITADYCGYCRYIKPIAEKICNDNNILFIKLNAYNLPKGIDTPSILPTFLFRVKI